jgi:hypothetical protein
MEVLVGLFLEEWWCGELVCVSPFPSYPQWRLSTSLYLLTSALIWHRFTYCVRRGFFCMTEKYCFQLLAYKLREKGEGQCLHRLISALLNFPNSQGQVLVHPSPLLSRVLC